jgi:hypothetical protein
MEELIKQILPFTPYIIIAILVILFLFKGRLKELSISKERGLGISFKDDAKDILEHNGKVFVNPELSNVKLDLFLEQYNDLGDEIISNQNLFLEQQMKYSQDKWENISYYISDYYTTKYLKDETMSPAEKKAKYLLLLLNMYWFGKLKEQLLNSFRKNGFHPFRKMIDGKIVDETFWKEYLSKITISFFHSFRHYLKNHYSFDKDFPVDDILTDIGFQKKANDVLEPDKICLSFINDIYLNSWQQQETEKSVMLDFRERKTKLKEKLKIV